MKLHAIVFILVIIGGLNWGLVALGNWMGGDWNIVKFLLRNATAENIVYLLIGVSAVVLVSSHKKDCRHCGTGSSGM
ncbi:MAG: DUF378 domain-containing protein [bacterium]|nr:DUF378 domain-containing protein [bacterium]